MSQEPMKLPPYLNASYEGDDLFTGDQVRELLAKQEKGEPVAYVDKEMDSVLRRAIIRSGKVITPQQRTWVGLTEDDKVLIKHDANFNQFMTAGEYADRVQQLTEARLKDKNNG